MVNEKKKNKIPAFRTGNGLLMKERPTPDFVNVSPKNHLQIMGRYVDVVS